MEEGKDYFKYMDYGASVSQKGYDVKTCADRFLVYSSAFQTLKIHSVSSVTATLPTDNYGGFTAATTDIITATGTTVINGDPIEFWTNGTLPNGLLANTRYWVINKSGNTFKVSLIKGGSAVDITSTGAGSHSYQTLDNLITITHNLGYLAPFVVIYNGSTTVGTTKSYMASPSVLPIHFDIVDEYLHVEQSTNNLKVTVDKFFDDGGGALAGDTMYFTVYLFVNDFTTIAGTNINIGTTLGASSADYGIRISKDGFDVKTCADIDCVLSSSFFNQIIHSSGIDTSAAATINIAHNLGYIPSYLVFVKESVGSTFIRLFTQTEVSTTNLIITNPYSYYAFYFIIFKQKNN